jgi:hypothetical protein
MKQFWLLVFLAVAALFLMDRALHPASEDDGVAVLSGPWQDTQPARPSRPMDLSPCGFVCTQTESGLYWALRGQPVNENDCDIAGYGAASGDFANGCRAYLHGETQAPSGAITPGWNSNIR